MQIQDSAYGMRELTEPVLVDLINSAPMQRLKGISQLGMPREYYHLPTFSRYEHSIGTALVLKKVGADLEEVVAGLLHDVSHTAFSHVVDWVIGNPAKEDYQDKQHSKIIENSGIPKILKNHGFNYKIISDIKRYSLLDSKIPNLCADRFDYAVRDPAMPITNMQEITTLLDSLVNYNGMLVFSSKETAEKFARGYAFCQKNHWSGAESKIRYYLLAKTLKRAIKKGIISREDFRKTDEEVSNILLLSKDAEILDTLSLLREGLRFEESKNGGGIFIKKKLRYVDPFVLYNGKGQVKRLTELSEDYRLLAEEQKKVPLGKRLQILRN